MSLLLVVAFVLCVGFIILLRPVSFGLLFFVQQLLVLIGLLRLGEGPVKASAPITIFILGTTAFLSAYAISRRRIRAAGRRSLEAPLPNAALWLVTGFVALLTAYHFTRVGIPLFASDVERARFDFSSSGLFGLPGRMYLVGTKVAWVAASLNARALNRTWSSYGPWRLASVVLFGSAFLSGFKGQLLSCLILSMLVYGFITPASNISLWRITRRYSLPLLAGIAYFFYAASRYQTYAVSQTSGWRLLVDRLTGIAAQPVGVVLSRVDGWHPSIYVSDASYFAGKYLGKQGDGSFTFEREIAAYIYNVNPGSSSFTPPVTIGGVAETLYGFGVVLGLVFLVLAGMLVARLEDPRNHSVQANIVKASALFAGYLWLTRGGLIYILTNWSLVLVLLLSMTALVARARSGQTGNVMGSQG